MSLDEFGAVIARQALAAGASYQLSYHRDNWHAVIRFHDDPAMIHPVWDTTLYGLAQRSLLVMSA